MYFFAEEMDTVKVLQIFFMLITSVLLIVPLKGQDMHGPPVRPKVFRTADELREYLKALNEYFAIVGRPR